MITTITILIFSCSGTPEKDASHLVGIHREKTGVIKQLLMSQDSLKTIKLLDEVKQLDMEYSEMKNYCKKKYADSLQSKRFDEVYRRLLE